MRLEGFSIALTEVQFQLYGDTLHSLTMFSLIDVFVCWWVHLFKIPMKKETFERLKLYYSSHEVMNNHKVIIPTAL